MRILALVPGGVDEQILFFPTLEDLKKQYPKATIDVIVEPHAKSAYRVCPYVNEVLLFDYRDRNGLADYLNLLGIIRDREYDMALSWSQRWTIAMLLWLNGILVRIGYQNQVSWFLTKSIPLKTKQYAAYKYHDLLQGLGLQSPCPELKVTLSKEDINWVETEQKRLDIKESGYILIYDCFPESEKTYSVVKWRKIIEDIQQKQPNLSIVLLQSFENTQWVSKMLEGQPSFKVTNPPDVGKIAGIIAGANLMLCTDSVPLQLSVAVGTYTIALLNSAEAIEHLPPNSERSIGILSPTQKVADIEFESILQQMWRS